MRRREVMLLLAGAATNWPLHGSAQTPELVSGRAHVGILNYAGSRYARVIDFLASFASLATPRGRTWS